MLQHLRDHPGADRRELARTFGLKGAERIALKAILKELERDGLFARGERKPGIEAPGLLEVKVVAVDLEEAEALARPVEWSGRGKPPLIRLRAGRGARPHGEGERLLVRIRQRSGRRWEGEIVRAATAAPERVVGAVRATPAGPVLDPADRRLRIEFSLEDGKVAVPPAGELVLAEVIAAARALARPRARAIERLGRADAAGAASLIAIAQRGIPDVFPPEVLAEAAAAKPADTRGREDLRAVPLVTIDGEDARDFDDAVHAVPDLDARNPGGFRLTVAIADVAYYVRPSSPLDREALRRGNSVYFPDRVVPMLPERLSNDLCSLRPHEDRPVLAVEMIIGADGRKRRHRFMRATMRSTARLTYEQAQAHADGRRDALPPGLDGGAVDGLFAAFRALHAARRARGTLDLDLEERKVELGADGRVARIVPRPRLDAHRLIEEFMILANVCAAETLEQRHAPCLYRVHDQPSAERVEALRVTLESLGYRLARGQKLRATILARILEWAADRPFRHMVNDLELRTQALAVYSPGNLGHFGLALPRYAHFTSPIRRYADLVVHRSLIEALALGQGGLPKGADLAAIGEHVSDTERRAAAAERDAMARYVAAYLADRVGATFPARISGVERFGLFATLDGIGADGLIPMARMGGGYWRFEPERKRLVEARGGRVYALGDPIEVELLEANALAGSLLFALVDNRPAASRAPPRPPPKRPRAAGRHARR